MIKVYIASPYTKGNMAVNVGVSLKAFDKLMKLGYAPYAPLLSHFVEINFPHPYNEWLDLDIEWLEVCDAVLRLPGESSGADKEVITANENDIPVFYTIKDLNNYFFHGETYGK